MAPDVHYGFTHHASLGNITGDVYTHFLFFKDAVNEWYDNAPYEEAGFRYHATKEFLKWFYKDNDDSRAYCIIDGIRGHGYLLDDVSKIIVHDIVENSDASADEMIDNINNNCFDIVGRNPTSNRYLKNFNKLVLRSKRFSLEQLRRVYNSPQQHVVGVNDDSLLFRNNDHQQKTLSKEEKKVLKKSASILDRTLGSKKSSMFVSGEKILVEGQRFDFYCGKGYSKNHISLSVYDKTDNTHLVNLCWYIQDTPAMDQVAAVAMIVMSGNEDEIIQVGNFMSLGHTLVERYPEFSKKTGRHNVLADHNIIGAGVELCIPIDDNHIKYVQVLNNTQQNIIGEINKRSKKLLKNNRILDNLYFSSIEEVNLPLLY